jgi:hypothetical protein
VLSWFVSFVEFFHGDTLGTGLESQPEPLEEFDPDRFQPVALAVPYPNV